MEARAGVPAADVARGVRRSSRAERDRVRARRLRRSLPSLLSCGRLPHPCPSPVRAIRFTHVGFSLLPPPARRSRVAGRGRGGGWLGEARGRRERRGGWARAAIDSRAQSSRKRLGEAPPTPLGLCPSRP